MHNTLQMAYIQAKVEYDQLTEKALIEVGEYTGREDDEEAIRAFVERETDIYQQLSWPQAFSRLHKAEEALLSWAHEIVKQRPEYTPEVGQLFTTNLLTFRKRTIDLALRIKAREGVQS